MMQFIDNSQTILQCLCVALVAALYSAVGHGGATGYIALLSLFGLKHEEIATTALLLNTIVAGISLLFYARAKQYNFKMAFPYLILSIPLAYIGAKLPLPKPVFAMILGVLLLLAALRFLFFPTINNSTLRDDLTTLEKTQIQPPSTWLSAAIGGVLGLFSGIVGIGGGVFLSPILIFNRWASTKQTSAIAALFIVVNSVSGLAGRLSEGPLHVYQLLPFLAVAAPAALLGSIYGAGKFSSNALQRLLAVVLMLAAIKLFVSGS